jgi:hypothetical protein
VYINTRGYLAALINVHAANWPRVLKYTRPIVHLALPSPPRVCTRLITRG